MPHARPRKKLPTWAKFLAIAVAILGPLVYVVLEAELTHKQQVDVIGGGAVSIVLLILIGAVLANERLRSR